MKHVYALLLVCFTTFLFCEDKYYPPIREKWNYIPAMKKFSTLFKGTEGVILHIGDNNTWANHSTKWARLVNHNSRKDNYRAEDTTILQWSHADKDGSQLNGWWLAYDDAAEGRSHTAAGGLTAELFLKGGHKGLLSAEAMLAKYNPQVAFIMLGSVDMRHGKTDPGTIADDMDEFIKMALKNGTIPVLITIPPSELFDAESLNKYYRKLARKRSIPMIDLHNDILRFAKKDWQAKFIAEDKFHLTHRMSEAKPTVRNIQFGCGYLLRCYLTVEKLKDIHKYVLK